ncbi:MAG TPA: hypothetical protein VIL86_19655 [Tepidisphaeraceae bacterium]
MTTIKILTLSVLTISASACQNSRQHGEQFPTNDEVRTPSLFANKQAASGARNDATLYAYHFDGDSLNSAGEAKLDSMLHYGDNIPKVVVYLDLREKDAAVDAHRKAVEAYLKDCGVLENQLKIEVGSNPANHTPAAAGLNALSKMEGGSATSADANAVESAPAGAAAPAK